MDKFGIQLENINELRKYPFSESSTLTSDSGDAFPTDIITELHVVAFFSVDSLRLSFMHVGPTLLSVVLSDAKGPVLSLSTTYNEQGFIADMESLVDGISGTISIGKKNPAYVGRTYRFSSSMQSGIHPFCILEFPNIGVSKIVDDVSGKSASGEINLTFEGGLVPSVVSDDKLSPVVELSMPTNSINSLSNECLPTDPNTACVAPIIQTISGVSPTKNGEIAIVLE